MSSLRQFLEGQPPHPNPRAAPWVHHVTFARHLPRIAAEGLTPQCDGGMSFEEAPQGTYWTAAEGVSFWYNHALEHAQDTPPDRRLADVPVVLRARRPKGLQRDATGSHDAGSPAWYGAGAPPEALSVWDGVAWRPIAAWAEVPLRAALVDVLGEDEFRPLGENPLAHPGH